MEDDENMGGRAVGPGLILIIAGAALAWMGLDLLSGGALTRVVTGGAASAAVAAGNAAAEAEA
jgi:hypothetical protein